MSEIYDGGYSLHVVYPGKAKDGNYIEISNVLNTDVTAGEYDIKFHIKGIYSTVGTQIKIGENIYKLNDEAWTVEENLTAPSGEVEWKRYTSRVLLSDIEKPVFKFVINGPVAKPGCFIDDVSLSPVGAEENYIVSGGFESYVKEEIEYDGEAYIPTSIMTMPATDGAMAISWKNPQTETVEKILLYDVTDGSERFIADNFPVTKETVVTYKTKPLTADKSYLYKLVFEYSDVPDMEYFVTATAKPATKLHSLNPIGSWTPTSRHEVDEGYSLQNVMLDSNEKHGGEASLRFISNAERQSNIYLSIATKIAVTPGKDYQLSYWIKSDGSTSNLKSVMNWKYFDKDYVTGDVFLKDTSGTFDWKHMTAKKTAMEAGVTELTFMMDYKTNGLWIDDVEFYELDENGEITGENLIADGDFENLFSKAPLGLTKAEAEPGNGSVKLSWTAKGEDNDGVNLYQKVGEKWVKRGFIGNSFDEAEFSRLMYQSDYEMRIVPANADGVEGEASDLSFATLAPDYEISNPQIIFNSKAVEEISESGYYSAKVNVKNNAFTDGMDFELFVGIYRNKAMYKAVSVSKIIGCTPANSNPANVGVAFEIPDDGEDYSVKLFSIDSKAGGKVLYPCVEIK